MARGMTAGGAIRRSQRDRPDVRPGGPRRDRRDAPTAGPLRPIEEMDGIVRRWNRRTLDAEPAVGTACVGNLCGRCRRLVDPRNMVYDPDADRFYCLDEHCDAVR